MDFEAMLDDIFLEDCPTCGDCGLLEEECGKVFSVSCIDCGSHTVGVEYKNDDDKLEAAKRAASLWNMGKVIKCCLGE